MTTPHKDDKATAEKPAQKKLTPAAPETGATHHKKRKRLAKAFKQRAVLLGSA